VEVLEHTSTGARGNFDRDFADAVVKANPTKFRLVPPSQYRPVDGPGAGQYRLSGRGR
jgi:hypothetical protein